MRIEGKDASGVVLPANVRSSKTDAVESAVQVAEKVAESRDVSHLTDYEKRELPISDKVVMEAIEKANRAISVSGRKFEYSIHEKTKEIMIKVIDADTNEIIREIPPEKVLDMVAKMWEMAGLVVDERR